MGRYPKAINAIDIKKQSAISEFSQLLNELPAEKVQTVIACALSDIGAYLKNIENHTKTLAIP